MNNEKCKISGCVSKCIIPVIAVFIFMFAYGMFVHGVLLKSMYAETPVLWRSEADIKCGWMIVCQIALAALFTCWYGKWKKAKMQSCNLPESDCKIGGPNCPIKHSLCFGNKLGLILGFLGAMPYAWIPVSMSLGIAWFIAGYVQGILIGVILALTCKAKAIRD